ncbi:MAG: hypothetical protein AB1762_20795 [Gemmatimonadota bacterium]
MTVPDARARAVPLIRLAMLGGAGLFGGVVGFLHSQGDVTATPALAQPLTLAGRGVWGVAIAGCVFLWGRIRAERDPEKILAQSIIGWALAESTAIFGAAYWYLVGSSNWYFPGLGFLALALLALPGVRRSR